MKNNKFLTAAATLLLTAGAAVAADDSVPMVQVQGVPPAGEIRALRYLPTREYGASRVETKLNVDIKDGTQAVHFIRDNSDPYVITKAYVIRNADPFILRGVLMTIVGAGIQDNPVGVDSIMYEDGVGVLLVAAEEYRFKNAGNGMSMDELVAALDKKGLPNSSGTIDMAYFPRYNTAANLLAMMMESGIGFTGAIETVKACTYDPNGLHTPSDKLNYALVDNEMNAIIMTAPGFDMKQAMRFLKEVDMPYDEIQLTYKLVEIYAENDQKLGLDFQSWKNNDGIDLFSVGGKYGANNWNSMMVPNSGSIFSEYYNFNPKWNTKYVDFLTTCGKARVVSSGKLVVANGGCANVTVADDFFKVAIEKINRGETQVSGASTTTEEEEVVTVNSVKDPVTGAVTTTTTTTKNSSKDANAPVMRGRTAFDFLPQSNGDTENSSYAKSLDEMLTSLLIVGNDQPIEQGNTQKVVPAGNHVINLAVSGSVLRAASNLNLALYSTSLIGWDGTGAPRLATSSYTTTIQIGNSRKDFVVGGVTKTSVVRSVSGIPFLKDLPIIGWAFSTESDTVKKSQFVLIASAEKVTPDKLLSPEDSREIKAITDKVEEGAAHPAATAGFQQLWLDGNGRPDEVAEAQAAALAKEEDAIMKSLAARTEPLDVGEEPAAEAAAETAAPAEQGKAETAAPAEQGKAENAAPAEQGKAEEQPAAK